MINCYLINLRLVQAIELLIQQAVQEEMNEVQQQVAGTPAESKGDNMSDLVSSHGHDECTGSASGIISALTETANVPAYQSKGRKVEAVNRKPARNKVCSCGSNQKYKNCCGALISAAARRQKADLIAGHEAGVAIERMQTLLI